MSHLPQRQRDPNRRRLRSDGAHTQGHRVPKTDAPIGATGPADKAQNTDKPQNADKAQTTDKAQNADKTPIPDEARIRLQFTSPTKPALITGSTGNGDEPAPDYRYLVVPLRALAGA